MSKLTSAIDAKSLAIGVLLAVVVFMSLGANFSNRHRVRRFNASTSSSFHVNGTPFHMNGNYIYVYE
jgi:hypothetical protein